MFIAVICILCVYPAYLNWKRIPIEIKAMLIPTMNGQFRKADGLSSTRGLKSNSKSSGSSANGSGSRSIAPRPPVGSNGIQPLLHITSVNAIVALDDCIITVSRVPIPKKWPFAPVNFPKIIK